MMRLGTDNVYIHLPRFIPISPKYKMTLDTDHRQCDTVFFDMLLNTVTLEFDKRKKKNVVGGKCCLNYDFSWLCYVSFLKSIGFNGQIYCFLFVLLNFFFEKATSLPCPQMWQRTSEVVLLHASPKQGCQPRAQAFSFFSPTPSTTLFSPSCGCCARFQK